MVKSPMEYFQEQDFSMDPASGQDLNPTERAFLKKYLGVDDVSAVQGMRAVEGRPVLGQALDAARSVPVAPAPTFTLEQISRAGVQLVDAGKLPQLMGLLNKYGVQAVTQLDPGTYGAVATELRALGAQI